MITIGELAARHGITHRTLRFYEQRGLIVSQRDGIGRIYTGDQAQKLAIVLEALALGFTIREVPDVIAGDPTQGYRLEITPDQARKHLEVMHARMIETQTAVARLRAIVASQTGRAA